MFESRHDNSSMLFQKRQSFLRDIQNISKEEVKKRARSSFIYFLNKEELSNLIEKSKSIIKKQDLSTLIKYANSHYQLAIAHLGNLILDNVVQICELQRYHITPGYHPYWLWLIEVLVQKEYCTLPLLDHCIKSLSAKRSDQTVKKALTVLYKITSSNLHSPLLLRDEEALISIFNACSRQKSTKEMAYLLINELIKRSDQNHIQRYNQGIIHNKLVSMIIDGSLCKNRRIKVLCCKILTELAKKNIVIQILSQSVCRMIGQSLEMNFNETIIELLSILVLKANANHIIYMIDIGMILQLGKMKEQFSKRGDEQKLDTNLILLGREINQKCRECYLLGKGIHRQLQKYGLLGYSQKLQLC